MVGIQILPGIDNPETVHAETVASHGCDSVSVVFLESPMPLASSGSPAATGAPSGVVDPMQMLFGVQTRRLLPTPLGNINV